MYLSANFATLIEQGWILRYVVMFYDISINHILYYTVILHTSWKHVTRNPY